MTYAEKLKDPRWQRKRLEVFNRDNFTCRDCGVKDKPLHVHHCHYEKGDPWKTHSDFLLTLCEDCHNARQESEDTAKIIFGRILAAKSASALHSFVAEMARECPPDYASARIMHGMTFHDSAAYRWMEYAADNPEFRSAYCAVTGEEVDWSKFGDALQ